MNEWKRYGFKDLQHLNFKKQHHKELRDNIMPYKPLAHVDGICHILTEL